MFWKSWFRGSPFGVFFIYFFFSRWEGVKAECMPRLPSATRKVGKRERGLDRWAGGGKVARVEGARGQSRAHIYCTAGLSVWGRTVGCYQVRGDEKQRDENRRNKRFHPASLFLPSVLNRIHFDFQPDTHPGSSSALYVWITCMLCLGKKKRERKGYLICCLELRTQIIHDTVVWGSHGNSLSGDVFTEC